MKTIQEQLADKIYELLPHKKELWYGCKLNDGSILYDIRYEPYYKENLYWFTSNTGISHRYTKNRLEENTLKFGLKIIGQPIRLDEIAETLLFLNVPDKELLKIIKLWEYNKSFENQKEELYTELGQLILQ